MLTAVYIFGAIALATVYLLGLVMIAANLRDMENLLIRLLRIDKATTTRPDKFETPSIQKDNSSDGNSPAE